MIVHEVVDVLIRLEGNSSFALSLSWSRNPFDFASNLKSDIVSGLFLDGLESVASYLAGTESVNACKYLLCLDIIFVFSIGS